MMSYTTGTAAAAVCVTALVATQGATVGESRLHTFDRGVSHRAVNIGDEGYILMPQTRFNIMEERILELEQALRAATNAYARDIGIGGSMFHDPSGFLSGSDWDEILDEQFMSQPQVGATQLIRLNKDMPVFVNVADFDFDEE